jgi:hypothetical protein
MATTYKVLGQSKPSATTATTLYTCPSTTQTVISSLVVTNQAATGGSYRIAIRPNGAALSGEHYIAYDAPISATSFVSLTLGLTIDASDVLTIYSSSADISFNAFGSEIV